MFGAQDKTGWFIVVAALHSGHYRMANHQSTEQIVLAAAVSRTSSAGHLLTLRIYSQYIGHLLIWVSVCSVYILYLLINYTNVCVFLCL